MKKQKIPTFKHKPFHSLSTHETLRRLNTPADGLAQKEAQARAAQYGPNELRAKKESWVRRLIEPFTSLFVVVMLVAMAISVFTHERLDAIIIGVVVCVNALIYYFQQYSVSRVLASLRAHEDGTITVLRAGKTSEISVKDVTIGDLVYLFEGEKIPADGRLIETTNLAIDESILTGESLPVSKSLDELSEETKIYDQKNMVFKGTLVHGGSGLYVVTAIGNHTELGAISTLASKGDIGKTPIEHKIDDVTKTIIRGIAIVGSVVFALALLRGIAFSEAARFTLSLVVSVVPEGLPVTLTVVLLLSAKKMATHKALVKKLSAIETMGALTLIATDKTGTLTENKLEVAEVFPDQTRIDIAAAGSITKQHGVLLDPLDELLEKFFPKKVSGRRVLDMPFNQQLRMSGVLWEGRSGYVAYIKGAPEALLSGLSASEKKQVHKTLETYTSKGFRTIAFGHANTSKKIHGLDEISAKNIVFDGLVALADPLRPKIPQAIAEARAAGINVVMLTGDHKNTAEEIARQAGLVTNQHEVADSKLLEKTQNKRVMKTIISRIRVFGRVLPKHKFNFLKSIKGTEITAMTGDGVNDIPALVEADAGLSMGSGTDAAKDASDIVLLDDNFATIIDAVRIGRAVVANIRKMLFYLISTSIGEAATMIGALLFGMPLPVTAVQILWINLVTDSFTVMPIGLSKPEGHQMKQPPHNPKAPLLPRVLMNRTIFTGVITAAATLYIFNRFLPLGYAYAQTAAFTALVVAQWANALNAAYGRHSWLMIFVRPHFLLLGGICASIGLQLLVLFGPLQSAFGIVELAPKDLLFTLVVPVVTVLIGVDLHKLIYRKASKDI